MRIVMNDLSVYRLLTFVALSLFAIPAQAKVGTVAFVLGSANLAKSPAKQLVKKDSVDNGDTVVTGSNGRVQLRMIDGGKIAIRPDSEFLIEKYEVSAAATESSVVAAGGKQSNAAVLNLLKGGFRTITGDAAEREPQNYQVKTPVATMGIRGTHYQVRLCNANCGSGVGASDQSGLYVGVYEGSVWVESGGGQIEISPGEFVRVASAGAPPQLLAKAPAVLQDPLPPPPVKAEKEPEQTRRAATADQSSGVGAQRSGDAEEKQKNSQEQSEQQVRTADSDDEGSDSNQSDDQGSDDGEPKQQSRQSSAPSRSVSSANLRRQPHNEPPPSDPNNSPANGDVARPQRPLTAEGGNVDLTEGGSGMAVFERSIAWGFGPNNVTGDATTTVDAINNTLQSDTDGNGALVKFEGVVQTANGPQNSTFEIGTASVTNTGQDLDTNLRWGRWSDGIANVTVNGSTTGQNLENQSLHWIHSPLREEAVALPQTGTASYQLVGNTNPTDNTGEVGFLGSATLQADFTAQTVSNSVNLGIANENWQATGTTSLTNPQFSGQYNTVTVNGNPTGNGQFSGFFLAPNSAATDAPPAGAGVSFSLNDPNNVRGAAGVTVSGTAAFGDPQ